MRNDTREEEQQKRLQNHFHSTVVFTIVLGGIRVRIRTLLLGFGFLFKVP